MRGTNLNINFKNKAANINQKDYRRMGFSSGAAVGWEHRIPITEKFKFYHGPEVGLTLGYSTFLDTNSYNLSFAPRFGYVLGFSYDIGQRFTVALETIPGISSNLRIDDGKFNRDWSINAGFNQNFALLSFVYRFEREPKKKKLKD